MYAAVLDACVLAAAVRANAGVIVTANLKDFPASALEPFRVSAKHPDEFLLDLLDLSEVAVVDALHDMFAANARPPKTVRELADHLESTVPEFAAELRALL